MLTSVQGEYRSGKIELEDEVYAAELRARLAPFAEDWDSPEVESCPANLRLVRHEAARVAVVP